MLINGREFRIVGVTSESFRGPSVPDTADVWVPLAIWPELRRSEARALDTRASGWLSVIGRLRPGISVTRAQASLSRIAARLEATYPEGDKDRGVVVSGEGSPVSPEGRNDLLPLAVLLLTVTGLVLLIACANIANLLLARGAGRSLEVAIRAATGASRARLVRQFLTESLLLAVIGAGGGLLVAFWAADLLVSLAGPELEALRPTVDPRVLAFTIALGAVSVCAFGLAPALTSTRGALLPSLRLTPSAGGGRTRLQSIFVVTQLAVSLVLLLAAGLSLRALHSSSRIDLGFDPHNVRTASYDLVMQNYSDERRAAFRRDLLARVRQMPGVEAAALANLPPLSGTLIGTAVETVETGAGPSAAATFLDGVGPGYFSTMGIPIVRGRAFTEGDRRGSGLVAIVNQTLARRLWNSDDVVGRRFRLDEGKAETFEVIGVARDSKYDEPTESPRPFLYLCLAQQTVFDTDTLLVRASSVAPVSPSAVAGAIRALDPLLPVFDVRTFDAILRDRADKQRAMTVLFAGFGLLALLLAALGLYGVMAYATARRTREMGVRLALGATPAQLIALVARDGLRLALIGTVIGVSLAVPVAKVLGALVFGIDVNDLAGCAGACGLLIAVALVAAVLPARRAIRLDPIAALRTD
jgi:predicted permease